MPTRTLCLALVAALPWLGSADAQPIRPAGADPGGLTERARKCIEDASSSFTAQPTEISSGGEVTLTWSVSGMPSGCGIVKFSVDGRPVAPRGTSTVKQLARHTYVFRASIPGGEATGLSKRATVRVKLGSIVDITASTGQWKDLLLQAVGTPNTTVRLGDGVDMDLSGHENICINEGVTISSERRPPRPGLLTGSVMGPITATAGVATAGGAVVEGTMPPPAAGRTPRSLGPRLFTKTSPRPLFTLSCATACRNIRLFGFRIQGPHFEMMDGDDNLERGLQLTSCVGVEIANMEISGWSGQAIYVQDATLDPTTGPQVVSIHDNFIHHNQHRGGNGYGVDISAGGYAAIERNVFDFNRHAIAASGKPGVSYDARLNLVLKGGGRHRPGVPLLQTTHQFDVHGDKNCPDVPGNQHSWNCGDAGDQFSYEFNAFQYRKNNAIKLRGMPRIAARIEHNIFPHDDVDDAVALRTTTHVTVKNNTTDVDSFGQYGVCDFDADGKDDLFLPTGVTWWYASGARMHWVYLNAASERRHQLALGDFDGDRRCDVFAVNTSNNRWEISTGGTGMWTPVGDFGIPFDQLAFADFDADGATDVFRRAPDGQWTIFSIKKNEQRQVQSSGFPLKELRFGDFDGDGIADVLSLAGGHWSISKSATDGWKPLNTKLKDGLSRLLIADVNGNGTDDIVRYGLFIEKWEISWEGKSDWKVLAKVSWPLPDVGTIPSHFAFAGRFDGLPGADLLAVDNQVRLGRLYSDAVKKVVIHSLYAY
jgi:hypothetical protein